MITITIKNAHGSVVGQVDIDDKPSTNHSPTSEARGDDITDAQRRLMFRLAARLGFEGDSARAYVDRRLGPTKDRRAASRLIDDLQDEARRGSGVGHAGAA